MTGGESGWFDQHGHRRRGRRKPGTWAARSGPVPGPESSRPPGGKALAS